MRKLLQYILRKPIAWLAGKLSSSPHEPDVFKALSALLQSIERGKAKKGLVKEIDLRKDKYIIFSDQHKGDRSTTDDFREAEDDYLVALDYYYREGFHFVSLGDCEELWKFTPDLVMGKNAKCFAAERKFLDANRYYRIFGNHDLEWKYALQRNIFLRPVFGKKIKIYEGLLLKTKYQEETFSIFLAHGHQGDQKSDGNSFSIWFVANIWTPIQRFLQVSINTPATSFTLSDKHNFMMYEWSAVQQNLIFISGHTHKPVFASLDHIESLLKQLEAAKQAGDETKGVEIQQEIEKRKKEYFGKQRYQKTARPSYFNSGCCCFDDGDITGIELADGHIRLVKWHTVENGSQRQVLEDASLHFIFEQLSAGKTKQTRENLF